jgi:hypothetical protein
MLSQGEFVIPADVVAALGTQHFQKLIDKYHTPAEIQEDEHTQRVRTGRAMNPNPQPQHRANGGMMGRMMNRTPAMQMVRPAAQPAMRMAPPAPVRRALAF